MGDPLENQYLHLTAIPLNKQSLAELVEPLPLICFPVQRSNLRVGFPIREFLNCFQTPVQHPGVGIQIHPVCCNW